MILLTKYLHWPLTTYLQSDFNSHYMVISACFTIVFVLSYFTLSFYNNYYANKMVFSNEKFRIVNRNCFSSIG